MNSRPTDLSGMKVSAAVRRMNPGVFGGGQAAGSAKEGSAPRPTARQSENLSEKQGGISYKPRLRQDRKGPNKLEREFEAWLREEWKGVPGVQIRAQAMTLILANGVRYTADFMVTLPVAGLIEGIKATVESKGAKVMFFETKGFMRDDAAVKIKVAARAFPEFSFTLVSKLKKSAGGGWIMEEVRP